MKKHIAMLVLVIVSITMAGCSSSTIPEVTPKPTTNPTVQPTDSPEVAHQKLVNKAVDSIEEFISGMGGLLDTMLEGSLKAKVPGASSVSNIDIGSSEYIDHPNYEYVDYVFNGTFWTRDIYGSLEEKYNFSVTLRANYSDGFIDVSPYFKNVTVSKK